MIIGQSGSVLRLLAWQWRFLLLATGAAAAVTLLYMETDHRWFVLPTMPAVVVGAALGIFVSFRTNSSYDRWWEGRKLWGRLVNTSRHLAIEAHRYVPDAQADTRNHIIHRHIAYVHTLRAVLRGQDPLADDNVVRYLTEEEQTALTGSTNHCARLLDMQMADVVALEKDGVIDAFRTQSLDESVRHLLDIQGGCERIKKTPLPRIYGFFAERMIQWFSALLPCAMVVTLEWITIPVTVLVAFGFKMISETGRVLEDPFNMYWNALPLSTMSRAIERNLLEIAGETDLPEPWPPLNKTVIM